MHMTSSLFEKAAAHLAVAHSVQFETAQASLAEALGFASLNAALHTLNPSADGAAVERQLGRESALQRCSFLGLDGPQTVAFIAAIGLVGSEDDSLQERRLSLLRIVVRDLFIAQRRGELKSSDIREAFQYQNLEERCLIKNQTLGSTMDTTLDVNLEIDTYLRALSNYERERCGKRGGQPDAENDHRQVVRPLVLAMHRIERLERSSSDRAELSELVSKAEGGSHQAKRRLLRLVERYEFAVPS